MGVDFDGFGFGAGDFEEVVDELDELAVGNFHFSQRLFEGFGDLAESAFVNHGHVAFENCDWGFEFVGGDVDELVFEFVEMAEIAVGFSQVFGGFFDLLAQGDVEAFDFVVSKRVLDGNADLGASDFENI